MSTNRVARADQYQRRREQLAGWDVRIASYKLADRFVCEVDNVASGKTIERHGGVREDVRDTEHGTVRRYWIEI